MVRGTISSVSALRTRTYPSCKWKCMDTHSFATLVGQTWVKHRWNLVIAGQNVLFWRGSIKQLDLQINYRYRAETFRIYSYMDRATILCRYKVWPYAGQSQQGRQNWIFFKFLIIFDLHRSPVNREPIWLEAPYFLCLLYVPVHTLPVNGNAWTRIVSQH